MNKQKLIHQLFIGKVADVIGFDKTTELLKEAIEAFKDVPEGIKQDDKNDERLKN